MISGKMGRPAYWVAVSALLLSFFSTVASAKMVLRLGHTLSPTSHYQMTALRFAQAVKQRTHGAIEIQVFPQSQLGGEVQMAEALRTGTQDLVISAQAPIENTVKEWEIFDLPYLFNNVDEANHVLQGPVGHQFLTMLTPHNMIGLAWMSVLERDVFTTKKPIHNQADMKDLKIRVMQSPGCIAAYRALGANPTPLAYNQLYLALQQGLVDGGETSPDQFIQDKFVEVAKHFYMTHVNYIPVVIAVSKATWNKLSPDQRNALQVSAVEAGRFDIQEFKKQTAQSLALMKKKGTDVEGLDLKPWIKVTEPVRVSMAQKIPNGTALYKEIIAAKQAKK